MHARYCQYYLAMLFSGLLWIMAAATDAAVKRHSWRGQE
jgi:hypothetical protein